MHKDVHHDRDSRFIRGPKSNRTSAECLVDQQMHGVSLATIANIYIKSTSSNMHVEHLLIKMKH